MESVRIDSREVASAFRRWVKEQAAGGRRPPCLATVLNTAHAVIENSISCLSQ